MLYQEEFNFKEEYNNHKHIIYRGYDMSSHVLMNSLNGLGERDKMRGLPCIVSLFRTECNKLNNTGVRMLDSIYPMTIKLL